jgi:Bacterial Ig-like domain
MISPVRLALIFPIAAALVTQGCQGGGLRTGTGAGASATAGHKSVLRFNVPADRPEKWSIELTNIDPYTPPADGVIQVYAVPAAGSLEMLPPMIGRYEREGTTVRFVPSFPPSPGVTYVARAEWVRDVEDARFTLPRCDTASTTKVSAIYPTSDRVPANLLKMYIEFSAPMSDGEAERRIRLEDANGREIAAAFLHVDEELWDASRKRLTVLFDPGRIKRGLRANLEDGAPLEGGRTFRVVIDKDWRDGQGRPLVEGATKTLQVAAADRTSPDARYWDVEPPVVGTMRPLTVHFDEPLDRALVERWINVTDANGNPVAGKATIGEHEATWSFAPVRAWTAEAYQVMVDPRIEDLAGNTPAFLFDAEMAKDDRASSHVSKDHPPIVLPFTPLRSATHGTW